MRGMTWQGVLFIGSLCTGIAVAQAAPDSPWKGVVRSWLSAATQGLAEAGMTPSQAIKAIDDQLARYRTGPHLTPAEIEENRRIKQEVIHGTFDIRELCRIALARHWTGLSDAERDRFVQLMTNLVEEKAILSKEQGEKKSKNAAIYSVIYRGDTFIDPTKTRALTKTQVYVKSQNARVALDYKLRRTDAHWKIYDVIVDGSSLVENYQYQFDSIITKHGYPELPRRMEKKLAEIRSEKAQ